MCKEKPNVSFVREKGFIEKVCSLYQNGFHALGGGVGGKMVGESNDKFGNNGNGLGEYEPNKDKLVFDVCDDVDDDGDGNSNERC